jgi:hypothetical protein
MSPTLWCILGAVIWLASGFIARCIGKHDIVCNQWQSWNFTDEVLGSVVTIFGPLSLGAAFLISWYFKDKLGLVL